MKPKRQSRLKASQWLLLVPRFPAQPAYLRVKSWRRLRELGAVALRNAVYSLPYSDAHAAAMAKLVREIREGGGEALLSSGDIIAGLPEQELRQIFNAARDADYAAIAGDLRRIGVSAKARKGRDTDLRLKLSKSRQVLSAIKDVDFFGAKGRTAVENLLARLEHSPIEKVEIEETSPLTFSSLSGRIWVTRRDIHVDRIACAWLIKRFIDPKARFKFVGEKKYRPLDKELRFDMSGGEFTHEGDKCSFEVLVERSGRTDAALIAIAEIIHNLDLEDDKFARPETSGIGHVIDGICMNQRDDMERIARGNALFDDTYERFRRG